MPDQSFVWKTIAFYLVSGIIVESLISDPASGTLEVLMRVSMAFSCISAFLLVMKKWHYLKQFLTAIFVCENFIITLAIATEVLDFVMVMNHHEYREEISISLGVLLFVWYISVIGYLFRKVFFYPTMYSILSAFGYFIASYGLPMLIMEL